MSLKPLKVSDIKKDQKKQNAKMQRKRKEVLDDLPPYTFIISEGTKTEVVYIKGFADVINHKYFDFSTGKRIEVEGTGRNCLSLLNYARDRVEEVMVQATVVWLMYDRDDFPIDNFDNTQFSAEQREDVRKYRVAWSNESLELWFVLHFQELNSNIGRDAYVKILEEKFNYYKSDPMLFEYLRHNTSLAISRAKKQYHQYGNDLPPSQRCPATRVFELVEELIKYI